MNSNIYSFKRQYFIFFFIKKREQIAPRAPPLDPMQSFIQDVRINAPTANSTNQTTFLQIVYSIISRTGFLWLQTFEYFIIRQEVRIALMLLIHDSSVSRFSCASFQLIVWIAQCVKPMF